MPDARFVRHALAFAAVLPFSHALAADDAAQKRKPLHHLAMKVSQEGYPLYDIRFDAQGHPTATVTAALAAAAGQDFSAAWDADLARLRRNVPDVEVNRHPVFGVASWIGAPSAYLSAMAANPLLIPAPERATRDFVAQYAGLFALTPAQFDSARLSRNYITDHNGVRHLGWQQRIDGLDLMGCDLRASVAPDGRVIGVASSMVPQPAEGFHTPAPRLTALEALRLAARDVGVTLSGDPVPSRHHDPESIDPSEQTTWTGAKELRFDPLIDVTTHKVYFARTATDIRPAYAVVVPTHGIGHTYDTIIDAVDGTVLSRFNRLVFDTTQPVTYKIFRDDSPAPGSPSNPTPTGFQFPFITPETVTVQPDAIRAFSPNGWIPDGQSETVGNNTDTHGDTNGDNAPDLPRPNGGPTRDFSALTYNSTLAPSSYTQFSIVHMFYYCNWYHDQLYSMGFNEAAGNFQTNNLGNPGAGNDPVQCDAQDGSGTNNANWNGTGTDGSANRVQMYVFPADASIVDRDGTLDNDIVFHEFTHGLSTRLHLGLGNGQPRGMGEGWSDFMAITLNAKPGDDPDANYCTGGYATYGFPTGGFFDNYYFGIRRFPYSTNVNVNPQTFADIDPGQQAYPANIPRSPIIGNQADQVHNMGEVWCNTLLEGRAALWHVHGYPGNRLMQQLVVDGMKLVNTSAPTMLNERTAILQADVVNNGGANQITLWRAFAKRGMGSGAISTSSTSTAGITESYEVPQRVIFTFPTPLPTQLQPGTPESFTVGVEALNLTMVPDSGRLFYSINNEPFQNIPMVATNASTYTATLPSMDCFDRVRYYVDVDTDVGRLTSPAEGPALAYAAQVFTGYEGAIMDTGETNIGWTINTTSTAGAWQRAIPANLNRADPPSDSTDDGLNCWLTQNGPADSDVDNGTTTMTSPAFAARDGDTFSYEFWLNTSTSSSIGAGDGLFVEYATDAAGTNWQRLRTYTTAAASWRTEQLQVGVDLPGSPTMRVRIIAADVPPGNVVEAGFDNFNVRRIVCTGICHADFNQDGSVDGSDVEAFFIAWEGGDSSADVDSSGGVDGADVESFFIVWEAGGC